MLKLRIVVSEGPSLLVWNGTFTFLVSLVLSHCLPFPSVLVILVRALESLLGLFLCLFFPRLFHWTVTNMALNVRLTSL